MERIDRLRERLGQEGIGAFCVRDTSNIAYLTGFSGIFDAERAHALLVDADRAVLHTDSRYAAACRTAARGSVVAIDDAACSHAKWLAGVDLPGPLGIEDTVTLAEYRALESELAGLSLVETSGIVDGLRSVKDEGELGCLRAAQRITDAAFDHIKGIAAPGMTERELARELDDFMLRNGAEGLAFPTIVATGAQAANPHAQPTDAPLQPGQCVVMDFGARACGYCSDMTRMLFVGEPDAELVRAYDVLRRANETVQEMLRPGVTGAEAQQRALDVLEEGGFGGCMGHGLGHGVGIDVHEQPTLSSRNAEPLVAGNVVTVEPGIYIEGAFGMRLEDFGVVTEEGFERFTRSSHDICIV